MLPLKRTENNVPEYVVVEVQPSPQALRVRVVGAVMEIPGTGDEVA